jgi:pilus assembly protein Flp/PilA
MPDGGKEGTRMNRLLLKTYVTIQDLKDREDGQDMVEYALMVGLVALGAVAGLKALATGIASSFDQLSTSLEAARRGHDGG